MRVKYYAGLLLLYAAAACSPNEDLLISGPMLGYSHMREAAVWLQTKKEVNVQIKYFEEGGENNALWTEEFVTEKSKGYAATIILSELEPGSRYQYEVYLNGTKLEFNYPLVFQTQVLWQWRHDPPDIKFVIGSCAYINEEIYDRPNKPYGANYEIFDRIYDVKPDFMVWMGDNVYLREADWNSRSSIIKRYTHSRSLPQLQKLLASTHHYATWDDHDFGPNNSDRSWWIKDISKEVFELFWANPSYGIAGSEGITTYFQWGDLDFFLLDDRTFRVPEYRKTTEREILGDAQLQWLIDALTSSFAPFKFIVIGTQFLNPNPGGENHSQYPSEREKLLQLIEKEKIPGVIFLTGDVHRSEVTKLERFNNYALHEFTISPLTAGPSGRAYPNDARIDSTLVLDRNFGYFEVAGERKNRTLTCYCFNWEGKKQWSYTINENELKY